MSLTNFDTAGATSLHTTVEDFQLWDENFYHPRVGGPAFVQQMLERGKLNSGEQQDYASGLAIGTYKGLPTVGHGGSDAGYRSYFLQFPEQHFSTVILCNSAQADPSGLVQQVADIFLSKDFKAPASAPAKEQAKTVAAPLTTEQMAAIAGTYWNREEDDFARIMVKDGLLQAETDTDEFHPLKPAGDQHFHIEGVPRGDEVDIHFVPATAATPRHLEQSIDGGKPTVYEAVTVFDPTAAELAEYTGAYVCEEIDPVYRMVLQEGKLTLQRLKHKPETLRSVVRDAFTGEIGTIRFTRGADQRVSGFVLDTGRIQNFRFTKNSN